MLVSGLLGLVLVGAAFGVAPPTRCCFDKQYSVTLGDVGEVLTDDASAAAFIDGDIRMGFDYYRDRQAMMTTFRQPDGSKTRTYSVKDYAARKQYVSVDNGTCTFSDIPSFDVMRAPCIPDDATFEGPATFGYGAHNMSVYTWSFKYPLSADTDSQFYLSVSQDHCVPVTEAIIGEFMGTPIEQSLFFVNYHPGIENLQYLDIPTNCVAATAAPRRSKWF